ncbi:MAG: ATP-grasp domain-containing protein [Candidatus Bathyarchaeota archaeon]|nr:ATP-grasp domain-containing protein [Candidatus Bathyarchaeota archaeon]
MNVKTLIYEYASGGGAKPVSSNVLCEGFGMLRTLVSDLKCAGHQVTVLLDDNISKLNPPINADFVVPMYSPEEPHKFLAALAAINNSVYVVAPETRQTLQSLVKIVEETGKTAFNSTSDAIGKTANKTALNDYLKTHGFPTLKTLTLNATDSLEKNTQAISELNFPVVLKPLDDVSCGGICLIKNISQIEAAIKKTNADVFIAQEYVKGVDASVSLICTGKDALPISLNQQEVILATPEADSKYEGGLVPFNHPQKEVAFRVAREIAVFFGFCGYVGVDFVLTDKEVFAVDVNPRLTTSYVGLSGVVNFNVAQAIVDAVLNGKLPSEPAFNGYFCFSKVETANPKIEALKEIFKMPTVASPPFPDASGKTHALVFCKASSLEKAKLGVQEAKKELLRIIDRGN